MADKVTIGMSPENKEIVQKALDKGYFQDQMDVAKFAISLAIKYGKTNPLNETFDTTWNIGSFDSDQKLRDLIFILEPDNEEPYRRIEALANSGIQLIGEHFEKNNDLFLDELLVED